MTALYKFASDAHAKIFEALMHFKVIRAYIEGVLRFGIPPKFWMGVICPRRGQEKTILKEVSDILAEDDLKDMYGEKDQTQQQDEGDFWPFVSVGLNLPVHIHQWTWHRKQI